MQEQIIDVSTGRKSQVWFESQGSKLAIFHHGVPKPQPLSPAILEVFKAHGYSVACVVRAGYLGSTVTEALPMAADAEVSRAVAAALGFETFISVGYSGGSPRALADAALSANCSGAITFGSVAPLDQGFDALAVMAEEDRGFVDMLQEEGMALLPKFEEWKQGFIDTPFEATLPKDDPAAAAWLQTEDGKFRCALPTDLPFRSGAAGWLLDEISMVRSWGFAVSSVAKPVVLVTGDQDKNVDPSCSSWLSSQIRGSKLLVKLGYEHNRIFCTDVLAESLTLLESI